MGEIEIEREKEIERWKEREEDREEKKGRERKMKERGREGCEGERRGEERR